MARNSTNAIALAKAIFEAYNLGGNDKAPLVLAPSCPEFSTGTASSGAATVLGCRFEIEEASNTEELSRMLNDDRILLIMNVSRLVDPVGFLALLETRGPNLVPVILCPKDEPPDRLIKRLELVDPPPYIIPGERAI